MKIYWKKPSIKQITQLLDRSRDHDFSHANVGSTCDWSGELFSIQPNSVVEDGYLIQRRRTKIGLGVDTFINASAALRRGLCFDLSWVDVYTLGELLEGKDFCLVAKAFGLYVSSVCRVIYINDEETTSERTMALGLGTLPYHAAIGEERLAINWNKATGDVDFLIGSYSKPASWFSWMFVRYLRSQQVRFARDSVSRMKVACDRQRVT